MKSKLCVVVFLLCVPFTTFASVEISEIAWMGTADSSTNEWVELHATSGIDITGWTLETTDGGLHIALSGSIAPGGYYLIERTDDTTVPGIAADLVVPFGSGLANSGEALVLKDTSGSVVDEVNASGGWPAGDNTTKETMQRSGSSWVTAVATPKASNTTAEAPKGQESSGTATSTTVSTEKKASSDSSWQPYVPPEKLPRIKVFAGDDQRVVAGEELRMEGSALGFVGEPLPDARYIWNFGNSIVKEGRSVRYIYPFPGTYTVRLSVASGEHAAFDDAIVRVGRNSAIISEVMPRLSGWVELHNKGAESINLSGWMLQDTSGNKFILPEGTRIAPQSFIVFENIVTKTALLDVLGTIALLYPNGMQADTVTYAFSVPEGMSIVQGESGPLLARPTPGEADDVVTKTAVKKSKGAGIVLAVQPDESTRREVLASDSAIATEVIADSAQAQNLGQYETAAALPQPIAQRVLENNIFWFVLSIVLGIVAGVLLLLARRRFVQSS
ncbi:MAG: hypothetical protein A3C84_04885 [Candidatus Ryanbacteria bacterium RIFCSPHIGHO2_02_FULL_48_12]|uniref:PKD domain-containing protein n=1 Tax=Candidatus Ryanbacteria bacterium RIFCSPHIGHO2_01_FULL_48_27 TaxID=1802115 RepID=A0A1G2G5G0_9BACT|nr:MAG: hypothetical protein A2756_00560 [Candidatus Ryanbacteria bacterium RIFCSPHIGHO2_01_FULL_48_27]OGZ48409.1 MAG: hypothetical protein A3C84_04885 [Candidatus Ryanbacteria bacterium RIFCSPHIGHO2_02_FULL_48_12]